MLLAPSTTFIKAELYIFGELIFLQQRTTLTRLNVYQNKRESSMLKLIKKIENVFCHTCSGWGGRKDALQLALEYGRLNVPDNVGM